MDMQIPRPQRNDALAFLYRCAHACVFQIKQISFIIIYFENVHFFHAMLGLDVSPYEVPPHIPEYRPFRILTKHFPVIIHTFFPSLPFPPLTSRPCHLHLHLAPATSTFLMHNRFKMVQIISKTGLLCMSLDWKTAVWGVLNPCMGF